MGMLVGITWWVQGPSCSQGRSGGSPCPHSVGHSSGQTSTGNGGSAARLVLGIRLIGKEITSYQ